MKEEEKIGWLIPFLIVFTVLFIFTGIFYSLYKELSAPIYSEIITGEIINVSEGEAINAAGYVVSSGVGVALAESSSITIRYQDRVIKAKASASEILKARKSKIATIKETGVIKDGKNIPRETTLVSLE